MMWIVKQVRRVICVMACLIGAAVSQTLPIPKAFEVESVRRHQGNDFRTGPLRVSGNLIRLQGYTLFGLILDAYHIRDYQVSIGFKAKREDVSDTRYDIVAKAPGEAGTNLDDIRLMLQTLLADRFQLRVHREPKEMAVYALTVGKGGAKFKPSANDGECSVKSGMAPDGRNDEVVFTSCPMERLADRLTNIMSDRPVLDETDLPGSYDYRLLIAPAYRTRNRSDPADRSAALALGDLGLVLSHAKAKQEILVIDGFELPKSN